MKIRILTLSLFIVIIFPSLVLSQGQGGAGKGWELVWEDDFNGASIDTTKWNVLMREQSKHGELQYYVPDEVYVENGLLRLRSRVRNYGSMKDDRLYHSTVMGVPHTPHYLIINTAIGGSWPGNPDSTTVFPQYHDIDYVRLYRRPVH